MNAERQYKLVRVKKDGSVVHVYNTYVKDPKRAQERLEKERKINPGIKYATVAREVIYTDWEIVDEDKS